MKLLINLLVVGFVSGIGCASKKHTAVVVDTSIYEALNDIHQAEQAALVAKLPGWTLEKSQAFNKKLAPVVQAALQFNTSLKTWKAGQPMPEQAKVLVSGLLDSVEAVLKDFPDGTTKNALMGKLLTVTKLVSNAFILYAGGN